MVRAHIHFYGTVQGVGFRYTTLRLAQDLSLTGWVRNCSDGSVEAMAEGSREDIEALIPKLKDHFGGHIHKHQVVWLEFKEEFDSFSIDI